MVQGRYRPNPDINLPLNPRRDIVIKQVCLGMRFDGINWNFRHWLDTS